METSTRKSEYVSLGKSYCEDCFNKLCDEGKMAIVTDVKMNEKKMSSADNERWYVCTECGGRFFG